MNQVAANLGLELPPSVEVVDPAEVAEGYVAPLAALRARKGWTLEMARERLTDPITVGTMMLHQDDVDGLVSGAEHTTADTVRPALQILGTAQGSTLVSSVFFMCLPDEVLVYGDCAINPQPTAAELADIALQYDAAASASVGASKRPGSEVAGRATVFIFPNLDSGNTTTKAVQRSADVVSIGPMLQGLAKPVNDLSRGALVDDIVYTIALTAVQASVL